MLWVGVNPPLTQPTPAPPRRGPRRGSQEDRVRINGNYRGGSRNNCPLIFLSLSAQNPNFLAAQA
ncbi:MAG: hypothetical protein F6K18_09685 [Okeania sp. SIO2C2]|uniref:hypothetical protein n=1 Tax=unclassified Okeania TaxID=2634635 RepID=UPI0013B5EC46|nr:MULTISPECIES: hypothetical protein [unclassified Okeania]NEP04661.1 hypothetical protein [Okeania sp. SIO4D6]NEP87080.1 hypothetical protein [Okeania sp. SIO2C2]NEP92227.1 hypothetical protein [Okeania sp. SIO2F5]NEQ89680.1 hypothetical protein [Okeania sp. SIO2G4]